MEPDQKFNIVHQLKLMKDKQIQIKIKIKLEKGGQNILSVPASNYRSLMSMEVDKSSEHPRIYKYQ